MIVKKTTLPIWWDEIEAMPISHALWGTTYTPQTWVKLAYVENDAVYVNMFVAEKNPKAVYENDQDPVYEDSCLECFINFNPSQNENYINFEMNANGAMLVGYGKDRKDRQRLDFDFHPYIFKNEHGWGLTLIIPVDFIVKYYGEIASSWQANFYKCGDKCDKPHFLSWSEIKEEKPDFHVSKWFEKLECE